MTQLTYLHVHMYAPFIYSFLFTVSQEGTKLVGVDVIVESNQELLVELKGCGKLYHHLPHTLEELGKDGRGLTHVPSQVTVPERKTQKHETSKSRCQKCNHKQLFQPNNIGPHQCSP